MKLSGDIRVQTDKRYRGIYNDLRNFVAKRHARNFFYMCVYRLS
jgi:hypothetical protein